MTVVINPGDIYRDCSYHPVLCTVSEDNEIEGKSLIDGSEPRSCNIQHCGVIKLTQTEADELIAAFNNKGESGLMKAAGWGDTQIARFMKEWR